MQDTSLAAEGIPAQDPVWARRVDQALDLGFQDSFLVIPARRERRLPGCAFRTHISSSRPARVIAFSRR